MTVSATNITSGPYLGTGLLDTYSYDFPITTKGEIRVFETNDSEVVTELTVDINFTVSGVGEAAGGNVTRVAGVLPSSYTWFILSDLAETQDTEFESQGGFLPAVHEAAFDRLTQIVQQLQRQMDLSFKLTDDNDGSETLEIAEATASEMLGFNASGNLTTFIPGTGDISSLETKLAASGVGQGTDIIGHNRHSSNSVAQTLNVYLARTYLISEFNAAGDGVTNDATAFANAVTDMPAGSELILESGKTYEITGLWAITKSLKVSGPMSTLQWSTDAANQGIKITASDVSIRTKLKGPKATEDATSSQYGVYAVGTSAAVPLNNLDLEWCEIYDWGTAGVEMEWVDGFNIDHNKIHDCYKAGVRGRSVLNGDITYNRIEDIGAGVTPAADNIYGVQLTKSTGTEALRPVCKDIRVHGNKVARIPAWEGLDTHGGERISFTCNIVVDVYDGIVVTKYHPSGSNVDDRSPRWCVVSYNIVQCAADTVAFADTRYGIVMEGVPAVSGSRLGTLGLNNIVEGNSVSDVNTALLTRNNRNLSLTGNNLTTVTKGWHSLGEDLNFNYTGGSIMDLQGAGIGMNIDPGASAEYPGVTYGSVNGVAIDFGADTGVNFVAAFGGVDLNHIKWTGSGTKITGATTGAIRGFSSGKGSIITTTVDGDTDGSTAVITGIADTSQYLVDNYVKVNKGFPSTTVGYQIIAVTSTTITLDTNSDSAETDVTIAPVIPAATSYKVEGAVTGATSSMTAVVNADRRYEGVDITTFMETDTFNAYFYNTTAAQIDFVTTTNFYYGVDKPNENG